MTNPTEQPSLQNHLESAAAASALMRRLHHREYELTEALNAAEKSEAHAPSPALADEANRAKALAAKLLNGFAPEGFATTPVVTKSSEIRVELAAIGQATEVLIRRRAESAEFAAAAWAAEHSPQWDRLFHDVVTTAVQLQALEAKAAAMIEDCRRTCGELPRLNMRQHVQAILGIGNPLGEIIADALREKIVTEAEIRKAANV